MGGSDPTEVRHQQHRLVVFRQLMIDGEIAKVEEAIAHSRVLPIHDADGHAIIDEVGVEEVVVAQHRSLRGKGTLDGDRDSLRAFARRGQAPAVAHRGQGVSLDDPEGREGAGDRPRLMNPSQRLGDSLQHDGVVDGVITDRLSVDETRHQDALGFDEGDHLGADARGGRQTAGLALDAAVDAKQASAFRRNADDENLVVDGDTIVAVRDTAGERLGGPRPSMPARHPVQDRRAEQLDLHRCIA